MRVLFAGYLAVIVGGLAWFVVVAALGR